MPLPHGWKTLAEEWAKFECFIYPDGMGGEQRKQVRCAFYAGALVALNATERIGGPHISEAEAISWIDGLASEARDFVAGDIRNWSSG